LFSSSAPQTSSLFGTTTIPTNKTFGAPSSFAFAGSGSQPSFGQPQSDNTAFKCFGASTPVPLQAQNTSFGQSQPGTAVAKFQAPTESDNITKGGSTTYVQTKQQCITFMKEYAEKSIEELRVEDYEANRKGSRGFMLVDLTQPTGISFGEAIAMKHSPSDSMFNSFGSSNGSVTTVIGPFGPNINGEDSNSNQPMLAFGQQ